MKKVLIGAAALAALSMAATSLAQPNPAVVIHDLGCSLPGFLVGSSAPSLFGDESINVANHGGIREFMCHGEMPDGTAPAKATRSTGTGCTINGVGYPDAEYHAVGTPSGNFTLKCKVRI